MVTRYKCPFCNSFFIFLQELRDHIFQTHKSDNVKCPFCGKEFSTWNDFAIHLLTTKEKKHDDLLNLLLMNFVELAQKDNIFKVEMTELQTESSQIKNKDIRKLEVQDNIKISFACPYCGEKFDNINDLRSHMNIFHLLNEYVCPFCNMKFERYFLLLAHLWNTKDVNHRYLHKLLTKNLKIDVKKTNSKYKIYKCPICNFTTSWHTNLYRHMLSHYKED